jgi:hypothetical protein
MMLQYLDFDYSEDEHGHGTFEAMASVPAARLTLLQAEIAQVLDWAHAAFPHQCAPLEEGGEWYCLLEGQQEWAVPETLAYDEVTRRFSSQPGSAAPPWHRVTLALSGSEQFCQAFRLRFGV